MRKRMIALFIGITLISVLGLNSGDYRYCPSALCEIHNCWCDGSVIEDIDFCCFVCHKLINQEWVEIWCCGQLDGCHEWE